jgi:hypothetical protein
MDDELKQFLTAMEARIEGKIDAATDLLRTEVKSAIRDTETAMLTEFSRWSEGNYVRMGQVETMQKTLLTLEQGNAERMAILEGRMSSLEKRVWTKGQ